MFVRTIAQSANLRAFIHPMLRRLQEYDQAHSTALLHTLCVYLLQLDLDDAAVRNVLRTGCILLEYYQGAF